MRILLPTVGLAALLLAACQQDRTATTPAATPSPAATPAAAATTTLDRDTAVMDYSCEGGHAVVIVAGGDLARVTLKEGRTVDLPRDTAHAPPLYAGQALQFAITGDGGVLDRDDTGGIACQPAV